jgi:hypothetical protein
MMSLVLWGVGMHLHEAPHLHHPLLRRPPQVPHGSQHPR